MREGKRQGWRWVGGKLSTKKKSKSSGHEIRSVSAPWCYVDRSERQSTRHSSTLIISTTRVASTSVRVSSPLCLVSCTAATPRVWDSTPYKTVKRLQAAGAASAHCQTQLQSKVTVRNSLPDRGSVKGQSPQRWRLRLMKSLQLKPNVCANVCPRVHTTAIQKLCHTWSKIGRSVSG